MMLVTINDRIVFVKTSELMSPNNLIHIQLKWEQVISLNSLNVQIFL